MNNTNQQIKEALERLTLFRNQYFSKVQSWGHGDADKWWETQVTAELSQIARESEKEIVICAAVKTRSGKIFLGHRHNNAIFAARDAGWTLEDLSFADQGFVTSKNRYVTREEGRQLQDAAAIESASPEGYMPGTLFSEDLY